jgi:hypothetical protein
MNYLQDQVVQNYAGTAARGSAIGSAVSQGMVSYLDDSNSLEVYKTTGTAVAGWEPVNLAQSPNVIMNGAFEINQRGFTSLPFGGYGLDRWRAGFDGGTYSQSVQSFTPGNAISGYEPTNFYRIVTSGQSSASHYAQFSQPIEDVRTLAGQTATLSFWAKAASGTPKVAVELQQNFGSGGSPSSTVFFYAGQVTINTSWNRYSLTFTVPSISGKALGTTANTSSLSVAPFVSAGSDYNSRSGSIGIQNNTFDFWGVQLERGQTATPFRRNANSLQGELAACQRYYFRGTGDTVNQRHGVGAFFNSTTAQIFVTHPVPLRTNASSIEFSNLTIWDYGSNYTVNNITFDAQSRLNTNLTISIPSGGVQYRSCQLTNAANVNGFLALNAEL